MLNIPILYITILTVFILLVYIIHGVIDLILQRNNLIIYRRKLTLFKLFVKLNHFISVRVGII